MKNVIIVPILNNEYKVVVCFGDSKQMKRVLKSYGHDLSSTLVILSEEQHRGTTFHTNGCHPVICLPRKPKTPQEIGTLAHEAVHAVGYIFRLIEQDSAEEVYAHSVGAIVRTVLKNI